MRLASVQNNRLNHRFYKHISVALLTFLLTWILPPTFLTYTALNPPHFFSFQGLTAILNSIDNRFMAEVYLPLGDLFDILALMNNAINFVLYTTMSRQVNIDKTRGRTIIAV
jgi:hypothetical protein